MQPDVLTGACAPAAAAAADAHAAPAARSATFNTRLTADHLNGNLCIPWDLIAQLGEAGSRSKFKHLHLHLLVKDCWQHIALECSPQGMQIEPKAVHSMVQLLGGREQEPIMWMLRSEHGDPDTLFGTVVHKSRKRGAPPSGGEPAAKLACAVYSDGWRKVPGSWSILTEDPPPAHEAPPELPAEEAPAEEGLPAAAAAASLAEATTARFKLLDAAFLAARLDCPASMLAPLVMMLGIWPDVEPLQTIVGSWFEEETSHTDQLGLFLAALKVSLTRDVPHLAEKLGLALSLFRKPKMAG